MKKAKVFNSGNSQAVRLPKQFRLDASEVYIKKIGDTIQLIPIKKNPWTEFEEALDLFDDSYLSEKRQQPAFDKREGF